MHRLVASLAFLVRLSPFYEEQVKPLLEVLQAKAIIESKLLAGSMTEPGITKPEIKKLILEVAKKLCA